MKNISKVPQFLLKNKARHHGLMTWKGMKPVVNLLDKVYQKGVRLNKVELADISPHIIRHTELPKWDITIVPKPVNS